MPGNFNGGVSFQANGEIDYAWAIDTLRSRTFTGMPGSPVAVLNSRGQSHRLKPVGFRSADHHIREINEIRF